MINIKDAIINNVSVQTVKSGQKIKSIPILYQIQNEGEEEVFKKIFLKPFVASITSYEFSHDVDTELNVLFGLARSIYGNESFLKGSGKIHQHLQSISKHPNIKDGELVIISFDEIGYENKFFSGLGIFKIENKEGFLETELIDNQVYMKVREGISGRKLDKACLILFTDEPYTLFIIDNNSSETEYWKDEFLKVRYKSDNANNTTHILAITKSFLLKELPNKFDIEKKDQVELMNKSLNYFRENENFDINDYQNSVFDNTDFKKEFKKYGSKYSVDNDIDIASKFEIHGEAVQKLVKTFKNVLKLDKNFHIYIHGRTDLIEKGIEKNGRKFYKIYYNEEL